MKDLIERLRRSYVDHGTNYVQEAADEIERLTKALDFWKNGHLEMTKELFDVRRANDTAVDEYIKAEEKVIALTAERDALKAALQLIQANTNATDWPDDINSAINAAIQGARK